MNTFLSPDQETQRQAYRQFARVEIAPVARDLESKKLPLKEFLSVVSKPGFLGISVPGEYGGQGRSFLDAALFFEAIGEHEPGLGLSLASHYAVVEVLKRFGSQTQKSRYLPLLARGEVLSTLAFTEESAGTDIEAVSSRIESSGAELLLSGRKCFVINAELAGLWLVLARSQHDLALVLADTSDGRCLKVSEDMSRLGLRSALVNSAELLGLKLTGESLMSGAAGAMARYALNTAKVLFSATACGLLATCLSESVDRARTREQFGTTIGQFQGIQWKLADMVTELTGARLQAFRAAWSLENEPDSFARYAAMCKLFGSMAAQSGASEAVTIFGAYGLSQDLSIERLYRDAKCMEICLGTSEAQKLELVNELRI